jgi:hypothetical protein
VRDSSYGEQALAYRFAHLPLPVDAIDCEPWQWHGDEWRRHFLSREWNIAGVWISVAGEQNHRGRVSRWLHVGGEDRCTSSDRQRLIAALVDAGQLLDALNRAPQIPTAAGGLSA